MNNSEIIYDKTRQWWIIVSISLGAFIGALDNYIVNISLPTISRYFDVSTNEVARVTLIYLLILTSSLIIFGKIVDKIGVKKVFVWGFFFFTLGSLFCGLSSTLNLLILSRIVQGVGGSMLYASAFAIIPKFLPSDIRGCAFGIISIFSAIGITLGAPLGGIITGLFSWNWIFLVNVPVGIIAIIVSIIVIPKDKIIADNNTHQKFDITGAIMIFICLMLLIYGLNNGHTLGWVSVPIISSLSLSVVTFIAFILWERKMPDALIDLKLFKDLNFTYSNLTALFGFIVLAGANFLLPFYLILIKGYSEEKAGMIILIYSLVYLFVAPFMGRLSDKIQPRILCASGMIIGMLACLLFAFTLKSSGIIPVIIFLVLLATSYGCFISPNNNLIMTIAPIDKVGSSSAIFKTLTNLSLILGVIMFETVFTLFIPASSVDGTASLATANVSQNLLMTGFSEAFIAGAVVCLLTAICCVLIKENTGVATETCH